MQTVSVIIPAHNEEQTIKGILTSILNQKQSNFVLEKIIVVTDGCNDTTAAMARSISHPLVEVIENINREGKAHRINETTSLITSDLIFQVDADTTLGSKNTFSEMVAPFYTNTNLGLYAVTTLPFLQKILFKRLQSLV